MFGISFGEILLIALVGILVLKPNDIKLIYSNIRHWINMLNNETEVIKNAIKQITTEEFDEKKIYSTSEAIKLDVSRKNKDL